MIVSASAIRSTRAPPSTNGIPVLSYSSRIHPPPIPNATRPAVMTPLRAEEPGRDRPAATRVRAGGAGGAGDPVGWEEQGDLVACEGGPHCACRGGRADLDGHRAVGPGVAVRDGAGGIEHAALE